MAGLGNITTTLIITNGLFVSDVVPPGFSALTLGAGIGSFTLVLYEAAPSENYVAAVGSRVYQPGEFANSLKLIDPNTGLATDEPWHVIPRDQEAEYFRKKKIVTVKLVWNKQEYERTYVVTESRARMVLEVINFANKTKHQWSVAISNVKRVITDATVIIRKLRVRNIFDK